MTHLSFRLQIDFLKKQRHNLWHTCTLQPYTSGILAQYALDLCIVLLHLGAGGLHFFAFAFTLNFVKLIYICFTNLPSIIDQAVAQNSSAHTLVDMLSIC